MENLEALKVPQLRQLCKAFNLPSSGVKLELVQRLKMAQNSATLDEENSEISVHQNEVDEFDSVSQASSKRSKASSTSSATKAAAKRASLEVKARFLAKQQELEYRLEKEKMQREIDKVHTDMHMKDEELKLKMEIDRTKIEGQISAAAAEEEVLSGGISHVGHRMGVASTTASLVCNRNITSGYPQDYSVQRSPAVYSPGQSHGPEGPQGQPRSSGQSKGEVATQSLSQGQPRSSGQSKGQPRSSGQSNDDLASPPMSQGHSRSVTDMLGVVPGLKLEENPKSQLNPLAEEWKSTANIKSEKGEGHSPRNVSNFQQMLAAQNTQMELLEAVTLPKSSLMPFDGNPVNYSIFMNRFDNLVHDRQSVSDSTKLNLLLEYCTGKAAKLIQCCALMTPREGYAKARYLLAERFGDQYTISEAWVQKICDGPALRPNNVNDLQDFSDEVQCCLETLRSMNMLNQIDSQVRMLQLTSRLPMYLQTRWRREAVDFKRRAGVYPGMVVFAGFLASAAQELSDPVFGNLQQKQPLKHTKQPHKKSSSFHTQVSPDEQKKPECHMCKADHSLYSCTQFRQLEADKRLAYVKDNRLCFNCLKPGKHIARYCRVRNICGIQGCKIKHCNLLHDALCKPVSEKAPDADPEVILACRTKNQVALPIVPVTVKGPGESCSIQTHALLDPGSNRTFCSPKLLKILNVQGNATSLSMATLTSSDNSQAEVVELEVTGIKTKRPIKLPQVFAINTFPSLVSSIADPQELQRWDHLKDLSVPEASKTGVLLLIGQDVPHAVMPLEVRHGKDFEPYAVRTNLGWVIGGPVGGNSNVTLSNFVHSMPAKAPDDSVSELFWKMDDVTSDEVQMSVDDARVLEIWDKSLKMVNGHYQIDIPFKADPPELPDNWPVAERRLLSLGRRLSKDEDLLTKYKGTIDELVSKGYAEPVPDEELHSFPGCTWYLPHHSVANPNKEKIRVVFDCSAEYRGTSLNQKVMQGPDLTNSLLGVLLRFRQESTAVMADIEGMFHQVKVTPSQRNVLRFLWWEDGNPSKKIKVYRMTAHLFGGVWSPSAANYALRRTATDQAENFHEVTVQTVKENFYMDDGLKSLRSEQDAIELVQELCSLLKRGGFRLTKWVSNSKQVMESIPEDDRAKDVKDLNLPLPSERALGVQWLTETDTFGIKVKQREKPPTRRGLLSTMSSVYDPFGFVAPHVMQAKMLFQDECKMKKGWDDELEPANLAKWSKWLQNLHLLDNLQMDRCVVPDDFGPVVQSNLYHFSDASERAYGAVSYLRSVNERGEIHCTFLLAKSRLAPIRTLTIPRLELSAAVLAVQMNAKLTRELQLDLGPSVFYTDSTIVLQYIQNTQKRFKTFVANRVSTIHSGSEPSQWHHITSTLNPADDVSRGLDAEKLIANTRWRRGPDFLMSTEHWQSTEVTSEVPDDDEELKPAKSHTVEAEETKEPLDQLINSASSWFKIQKSVCWLRRFISHLAKKKSLPKDITVSEMEQAEVQILKYIQKKNYQKEIETLQENGRVSKKSLIYSLEPTLDEEGLLRVSGRLAHAPISENAKHPVILPHHHVTELVVKQEHQKAGHAGPEHVLSLVRDKFWIPKGRPMVKRVLKACTQCKRLHGRMETQKMADLPPDRLTPYKPPFSFVGVDCFGPFLVKRGRGQEKRYGCIFTCLTTRAIHIEKLVSLETDSFINALVRFCARRGVPVKIRSDRGTNFLGAQRELSDAISRWTESNQAKKHLLLNHIEWEFNPPAASHMGGVWERMIRSVRKHINAILRNQILDDERLDTVFCEVEQVVNSRPLTHVSSNHKDENPLTPNHLLLLRGVPSVCTGPFTKDDVFGRRWRHVQFLADNFWRRWLKEYLPLLQLRQKWLQPKRDLKVGDMVIVEETTPRKEWPLAKVIETHEGRDGRIRSVKIKTKNSVLTRPIHKLCLLEGVNSAL